jgi:hypothetical protein
MLDWKLLKQALDQVVRPKSCMYDPSLPLGQISAAALEEWVDQSRVDASKFETLVVIKVAVSTEHHH